MALELGDGDLFHINAIEGVQCKYSFGVFHGVGFRNGPCIN